MTICYAFWSIVCDRCGKRMFCIAAVRQGNWIRIGDLDFCPKCQDLTNDVSDGTIGE